jgi:hypothetical protein
MSACKHEQLALIPAAADRLRCRHCHLTIRADELDAGYCPECFEKSGKKRDDFEPVASIDSVRYRCESCGAIVEYREDTSGANRQASTPEPDE